MRPAEPAVRRRKWTGDVTMTDPGVKIAAAASVLLVGTFVALLFRHNAPGCGPAIPEAGDRLVLRKGGGRPPGGPMGCGADSGRLELPDPGSATAPKPRRPATVLTPIDQGEAPPALAKDYPGTGTPGTSGWGASIELPQVVRPTGRGRTHRIVDGDTLEALAQRYLGSRSRAGEIYEANRDVLPSAQLLPIGAELRIPPARRRTAPSSELMPQCPPLPIFRRAPQQE